MIRVAVNSNRALGTYPEKKLDHYRYQNYHNQPLSHLGVTKTLTPSTSRRALVLN